MFLYAVLLLVGLAAAGHEKCDQIKGVGPGYEKSYLDYDGKFKGGARKFLPIYEKTVAEEKDIVIRGGPGAHDKPCGCREKRDAKDCGCIKGVGPGYEKSFLDYDGKFKGGARKFLPIYEKTVAEEKDIVIRGGPGAHDKPCGCREKRDAKDCGCIKGVGPGYEKSFLDYDGKFKGGARKFLPIYEKTVAEEKDIVIRGGPGAHDKPCGCREKRDAKDCGCIKGVGPGYEKSFLDYDGKFKGGARKFLPIYEKTVAEEKDIVIRGGPGAHDKPCGCREKRDAKDCGCIKGVGPGYEKSFLDYDGKFKGGARKFLPIYEKTVAEEKDIVIRGGPGAHDKPCGCREKRDAKDCGCIKGVGPGYEKSFLDYDGKFKGGARKFLPIYEKTVAEEKDIVIRGGPGAHDKPCGCREKRDAKDCGCIKGVGPGYEKSFLDYDGKFKGGARKFLPIYEKTVAEEKDIVIRGGPGAHDKPCGCREKRDAKDCGCIKGVGPGYEKSFLDYDGKFKGGARKFLPIYEKTVAEEKDIVIRGGPGAHDKPCGCREKRDAKDCGCIKGVGPGYEKSFLDYDGKFKGGARKFLPIYEKTVAEEKDIVIRGGPCAHDKPCGCREKRDAKDCGCIKGVGPGYEKSFLDYDGKFKGGARKFLPIYEKTVAEEKDIVIRGGPGAHDKPCGCREKRDAKDCGCIKGVGPGYEKSFLDYDGKFKGGARKFLPIYEKTVAEEKDIVIRGGPGAHDKPCGCREKRDAKDCGCIKGVGPGYEKSFLDYDGKFKGGARKFLPIYEKTVAEEKDILIKGGPCAHDKPCGCREKRDVKDCGCIKGVGPGYEKSYLDYAGKFKGGARKFLPIYEKTVAEEKEVVIKGGPGAHDEPCGCREKRSKQ